MKVSKKPFFIALSLTIFSIIMCGIAWLLPGESRPTVAIVSFILAGIFGLGSIFIFRGHKPLAKRYQMIQDYIARLPCEGIFMKGSYKEKEQAKTIFKILGAILSSLLIGLSKVPTRSGFMTEYIVMPNGLLLITPKNAGFSYYDIVPVQKNSLPNPQIFENKNHIILTTGNERNGRFVFKLKNSGVDKKHLISILEKAFIPPIE